MFERVLMQLRDQINNTISHVQEEFFKAVDKKTEKLRYLDTQVEIDLGLGQIPLIKSMLKTINFIDEFIEKIHIKFILQNTNNLSVHIKKNLIIFFYRDKK